eukprot:15454797-Alexandrium_andersonii.AAC.2
MCQRFLHFPAPARGACPPPPEALAAPAQAAVHWTPQLAPAACQRAVAPLGGSAGAHLLPPILRWLRHAARSSGG